MPRRVRAAYSRTRCLPSPEKIPLRYVPACGEDFARSIPSGSPRKAKRRLCAAPFARFPGFRKGPAWGMPQPDSIAASMLTVLRNPCEGSADYSLISR